MMGKTWEELLQPGKLGGVEFDFISTTEEGGHDLDVQDVPGLVGNPIDDRSLKGERHQITGVFIEDDYPDVMNALLVVLRQLGPKEFVHPVWGPRQVTVESWRIRHDVDDAVDSAGIELTLVDVAADTKAETGTLPALANAARDAADAARAAADALLEPSFGASATAVAAAAQVGDLADDALLAANDLEAGSESMSVAEIQSRVNSIRSRVESITSTISDYTTPEAYDMGLSLSTLSYQVSSLGDSIINSRPPLVSQRVEADIPLRTWVHEHYPGETSDQLEDRIDQVIKLNDIPDPLNIPKGTDLRCYAA
jgi:prophage DNA circulation protein